MASVSMHKSGGSLTQSSFLLTGPGMNAGYVRQIINLTQTTSASYLLLSSLDISRRNLALRGKEAFARVAELAAYARKEINQVGGYYAFAEEKKNGSSIFDFDPTKLSIHTLDIGLRALRYTIFCGMNMTFRLNSETLEISWHIFPSATGSRRWNASLAPWQTLSAGIRRTRPACSLRSIFLQRWL